jgi:hypothetical protein
MFTCTPEVPRQYSNLPIAEVELTNVHYLVDPALVQIVPASEISQGLNPFETTINGIEIYYEQDAMENLEVDYSYNIDSDCSDSWDNKFPIDLDEPIWESVCFGAEVRPNLIVVKQLPVDLATGTDDSDSSDLNSPAHIIVSSARKSTNRQRDNRGKFKRSAMSWQQA